MIVAGIGCRKGTSEAEIRGALDAALDAHALSAGDLDALATGGIKSGEPGIRACARSMGLKLVTVGDSTLKSAGGRVLTHSEQSMASAGVGSLCEAAALAAVGDGGSLLGPRMIVGPVTCAIASSGPT